ncbi:hypothetical protein NDU88_000497 [Pleurodeles waltl]|uniref:Uncharacterized protein n=1 Tax=Pleurodeles waltl TaxID=8319 RepID=A0AAV7P309_PLEWA|nr:hypothetical protein NDU88_000497 [Pleurodeles waltl]
MGGTRGRKGSPGAVASGGSQKTKNSTEAPAVGPARALAWGQALAPKLKQEGEASPGPVGSQAWAPQGTAGWRNGVPVPGPSGGLVPRWGSLNTAT